MEKGKLMKVVRNIMLLLLLSLTMVSKAQIFIDDDEFEGTLRNGKSSSSILLVPIQGQQTDQYVPLGEEILLLACLGGAYLMKKKKKR
jgi:hypothetical protein